jgi:glutathione S-transferase
MELTSPGLENAMKHVELFGFAGSTYVRTARMVCEEKHVDYQLQPLEFRQDSHRALHPFLRMPVLRVGKHTLYETLAIALYIDEGFDGPRLAPKEAMGRAQMLQWISTCSDYLYKDVVKAALKDEGANADELAAARRALEVVDRQLQAGPFLLGNEIYLCDLFLAPMIAYAQGRKDHAELFRGLKGIAAWHDRLSSRASYSATQP